MSKPIFSLPSELKLAQLMKLATACGITKQGTKANLHERLGLAITAPPFKSANARILSIDLGFRNLALSLVTLPEAGRNGTAGGDCGSPVVLRDWRRISFPAAASPASGPSESAAKARAIQADEAEDTQTTTSSGKFDFSPAVMSQLTFELVQSQFLPLQPTHVLIERQRYRSGGGPAVLEWTLRVNMIEAMLYAIFQTMQRLDQWDGVVVPVNPKFVGPFLLDNQDVMAEERARPRQRTRRKVPLISDVSEADSVDFDFDADFEREFSEAERVMKKRNADAARRESKQAKIDLLGGWLRAGDVKVEGEHTEATVKEYLNRWEGKTRRRRAKKSKKAESASNAGDDGIRKLDDLADSFLQCIAWLRWQDNKKVLASEGGLFTLLPELEDAPSAAKKPRRKRQSVEDKTQSSE